MIFETDLSKRTHLYKLPPDGFDPLKATDRTLEEFGLVPRPSSDMPDLLAFWTLLFSQPLRFIVPKFEHITPGPQIAPFSTTAVRASSVPTPRPTPSGRGHCENSRNWSGLYLRSSPGQRFTWVSASWRVPTPEIPTVPPVDPGPTDPFHNEYRSSIWVGLDGQRIYPHVTIPQIGTWQFLGLRNGQKVVDIAAWWQWWSRDDITPTVKFSNLPVAAGDRILAALAVVSSDEVIFYIKNQSTGDFASLLVQAPPQCEPIGSTAEWIVERPTWPTSIWPHRMPKLADVDFSHCCALAGPRIIAPQTLCGLENARIIRMQDRFENPYRSAVISNPEPISATTARVRYQEANLL